MRGWQWPWVVTHQLDTASMIRRPSAVWSAQAWLHMPFWSGATTFRDQKAVTCRDQRNVLSCEEYLAQLQDQPQPQPQVQPQAQAQPRDERRDAPGVDDRLLLTLLVTAGTAIAAIVAGGL